jgi:hypothetical protein
VIQASSPEQESPVGHSVGGVFVSLPMGGIAVFRSPANERCFSLKNSHEKYVQKKSLDAIPTGIMFTPRQRCTDVQTTSMPMVPAAWSLGQF